MNLSHAQEVQCIITSSKGRPFPHLTLVSTVGHLVVYWYECVWVNGSLLEPLIF